MKNKWILLILNLLVFFNSITYLPNLFEGKLSEGYELAMSSIVFIIICFPFLIYYLIRSKKWHIKKIILMMFSYFIISLTGPILAIIVSLLLSIFFIILILKSPAAASEKE